MSGSSSQGTGRLVVSSRRQSQTDSDSASESGTSASQTSSSRSDVGVDVRELYNWNGTQVQLVQEQFGRTFSRLNQAYLLPTDAAEWTRSDKQHNALRIMTDLYVCPEEVHALLAPAVGDVKRILDIGCGSGRWAIEMAERFPHAVVHAIDISPAPVDPATLPANLVLEIDDANLDMSHFYGRFDVVHMRCILGGITDIDYTLNEMGQCLKPGGVLVWMGADMALTESDGITKKKMKRVEGDDQLALGATPDGSYLQRILYEAFNVSVLAGSDLDRGTQQLDEGLWDHELFDPETARSGGICLPIGPWAQGDTTEETHLLQYTGLLMRQVFLQLHRAYHGMLRRHGMDIAILQDWSQHADEEINSPDFNAYARFKYCWARRRDSHPITLPALTLQDPPLLDAPPLPATPFAPGPVAALARYRPLQVLRTHEEATAEMQRRATSDRCPESIIRTLASL